MTGLHGLAAPIALVALSGLAVASGVAAVLRRHARAMEWARLALLVVLVSEAAVGLALTVRGGQPSEGIHTLYGAVVVLVLLLPGALPDDASPRTRSGALALASGIGAALAWRLWSSG